MRLIDADKLIKKNIEDMHINTDFMTAAVLSAFNRTLMNEPEIRVPDDGFCENENENYSEVDEFRCSACGLHLEDWTRIEEECRYEYTLKFCPECGRKVRKG